MGVKSKYAERRDIDVNLLFRTLSSIMPVLKDNLGMEVRMLERLYDESIFTTPDLDEVRLWFFEQAGTNLKDHEIYNLLIYVCLYTPCTFYSKKQTMELLKEKCTLIPPTGDLKKWVMQIHAQQIRKRVALKFFSFTKLQLSPRGPDPVIFIQRSKPLKIENGLTQSICNLFGPNSKFCNKVKPHGGRQVSRGNDPFQSYGNR